ncbi:uncharacterized protein LOC135942740 [Cloeon dipterum]|uniref:uncharacterized protein LOC135942740 n=1 Tax=Cloeon dipterum TaxID=197152 RepID=UPI00321F8517
MKSLLVVAVALIVNSAAASSRSQPQTGESCEIRNAEFNTDYLYMSAGWVSQNPILWPVRPQLASRRKQYGKWRVEQRELTGKTHYKLWNHGAGAYLVAKGDSVESRKTSGGSDSEMLWKVERQGESDGVTLQQNRKFLLAKDDKSGEERELKMNSRSKKAAKWIITC